MRPSADTLLVWTGAACGYGCSACPIDPGTAPAGIQPAELERSLARLRSATARGPASLVVFLGGEPFLRPDLLRLMAIVRAAGCAPGLVTSGRALVYPHVRERLRRAGLAYLRIQLFGVGEMHDHATQVPGAFDQALTALRAWVDEGHLSEASLSEAGLTEASLTEAGTPCDVDVALSTRSLPMETVVAEVERLAREIASPAVQIVIAIDPAGRAELQETASLRRAVAALAHWNADPSRPLLAWEGLAEPASPASCLTIPGLRPHFIAGMPRACCLGALDELTRAGSEHRQAPRANSFNFVRTGTSVPWTAEAEACSAHGAAGGVEPYRQAWLVDGDRLTLYTTDTGDFEPPEVARIKDELSHLFIDRAPAGVLDDFTEGMRRLLPDPTCDACTHRARCGRRFRVVEGPPFAREEAWIATYIGGLRGRVLDVGCGEQLYRDQLGPLIRAQTVDYTGLDPDAVSLARLRAEFPGGRFHLGGIEDFGGAPASYDHILCLRSLNHVTDLDEALARMAHLLAPGGELLLVECTPFAMLREPEQVAAADRAPRAGHQHFRNLASEDVLPVARRRTLQILHHSAATLRTTNEWILLLGRAGG